MIISCEVEFGKKFQVSLQNNTLHIVVDRKPKNGEANNRIVEKLSNLLGCEVKIIRGKTSKNKIILFSCSEEHFFDFFRNGDMNG
jgi:uncharacterized protein YggU (UPF0235/DUF167 family)